MCLVNLSDTLAEDGVYYKVFGIINGKLVSPIMEYQKPTFWQWLFGAQFIPWYEYNKEYKASSIYIDESFTEQPYWTGFHVYFNKKDAENEAKRLPKCVVKRVQVRKCLANGYQMYTDPAACFLYMKVLEN